MPRAKKQLTTKSIKPLKWYEHQQQAADAFDLGKDRGFLAWHRRAGKDVFGLDFARTKMEERTGTYWHLFPFHVQARRAIWKGIDARDGVRFIDRAFSPALRDASNDTEMSIDWKGAHWQMLGSDNYDRMVGSNPCGVVFSEWALCDPAAWEYIRPILLENKGWALFITTFRGRNHAWRMFESIKELENWLADLRTVRDTFKHDGTPIISEQDVENEIKQGMDRSLAMQEFYLDPGAANSGAIYNRQYLRLLDVAPTAAWSRTAVVRVAWGVHEDSICAIAFQGQHVIAVHTFREWNMLDAVNSVARRHPHTGLIHHAQHGDPQIFSDSDGAGFVDAQVSGDEHTRFALAAQMLGTCSATYIARERLMDCAMTFAPYRNSLDDELATTHASISEALTVMRGAQSIYQNRQPARPLKYASDRGVI